jgi:hypothetical protein
VARARWRGARSVSAESPAAGASAAEQHLGTPFTLAEEWLGRPLAPPTPHQLVRSYLAAFGPATVADIQAWSGLTRLREVVEQIRPELRTFRSETGQELFDLPTAPRPDPDTPAPARLLPEFDNLMVAYADRTRIMTDEHRKLICIGAVVRPTVLIDGRVCGAWALRRQPGAATLNVELFAPLDPADHAAMLEEGARLLSFAALGANHDVQVAVQS